MKSGHNPADRRGNLTCKSTLDTLDHQNEIFQLCRTAISFLDLFIGTSGTPAAGVGDGICRAHGILVTADEYYRP